MPSTYHIKVTNDSLRPNKKGFLSIKLRIKYKKKHSRDIGVAVEEKYWDEKAGNIKLKYQPKYPEYTKYINGIYERVPSVRTDLAKGIISVQTAYTTLLDRNTKEGSILEWLATLEPDAKRGKSTIDKHISNVKAMNGWLPKGYTPITFEHLQDEEAVGRIATEIVRERDLSVNYQASLITSLNWVTETAKLKLRNPFTELDYRISYIPSKKNVPISMNEFTRGFNNINTMHQFEAMLFWLYSFCYLGLDGVDIANISEENIVTPDYDLIDYIPDADALGNDKYIKPIHIQITRKKSIRGLSKDGGVDAIFQCNLFPTLIIKELLRHCIRYNTPEDAYQGKDKLKLYNFDSYKDTDKWKAKRNSYAQAIGSKIGTTTQKTRHTISNLGHSLGMAQEKIDMMLNHKVKGVLRYYLRSEQTEQDVFQIHIFQEWGLLKCVQLLVDVFKNRKEIDGDKSIPYIPDHILNQRIQKRKVPRLHRTQMLYQIKELTKFSREDEIRYQTLVKKVLEGTNEEVDGVVVSREIKKKDYPQELKRLIEKRKKLYIPKRQIKIKDKTYDLIDDTNNKIKLLEPLEVKNGKVVNIRKKGA